MTMRDVLMVIGTFVGTIATVLTLAWRFAQAQEARVAQVYKRIDMIKEAQKKEFVLKEVCSILHERLSNDIVEIKKDVKLLLKRNGYKE